MEDGSYSSLKPLNETSNCEYININEVNTDHQSMTILSDNEEHDKRTIDEIDVNGGDDYDTHIEGASVVSIGGNVKRKCNNNQMVTFTADSSKIIDFILVYDALKDDDDKMNMRKYYEDNLIGFGIVMERELSHKDCFVKLHCTFETLCKGAELMKLKKPIKKKSVELKDQQGCFECCHKNRKLKLQVHQSFTVRTKSQFQGVENESDFFTDGERNYILYSLLEKAIFKSKDGVFHTGLGSLLGKNVYKAAYPLHSPLPDQPTENDDSMNERELLVQRWSNFRNLVRPQPLNKIKNYFGEQFTFYFAWMYLYTKMLAIASLAGSASFIYGLLTLRFTDVVTSDFCDGNRTPGNFTICPKCDFYCNYSVLSDACEYTKFTRVFENEATVAIALFICVWAVFFMELWKRKQLYLQHVWNVVDFEADENIRPQYYNQADSSHTNPLSGVKEPVVSLFCKSMRRFTSLSLILFLLIAVLAAIFSVIVYRLAVVYALYQSSNGLIRKQAKIITTFTAAILNVIAISILSLVYRLLSKVLTDLEAHKTRTSYEDSFIFKMVVFQFINNYGSIIYIAFFKGSFVDRPAENSLFIFNKYRQDECNEAGCFSELTIQLIIIMIGKQILNAFLELLVPSIKKLFRSRDNKDKSQYKQWEIDLDLQAHPNISMMDEYLEMVIQYGFVVMFVAAFPIAPLFALLNNVVEIRLDAHKMIKLFRRPPALKAQDIGAWQGCLRTISYVAVITNAFIIAWTSDFIPKMVYKWNNNNKSLDGYVEWSLQSFNVSYLDGTVFPLVDDIIECRYRAYSIPSDQIEGSFLPFYWQVLCARWAFVIVFEHVCFVLMSLTRLIPDESEEVKLRSRCEKALTNNINLSTLFDHPMQTQAFMNLVNTFPSGVDMFDDAIH